MILFAQPFSLGDVGGGPRILRSAAIDPPVEVVSLCTGIRSSLPAWPGREFSIPLRPGLGRLDRSRFHWVGGYVEHLWAAIFRRRILAFLSELRPTAVHLLPHAWGDFAVIHEICDQLSIPVHVSIHDDFAYSAVDHPFLHHFLPKLERLWRGAKTRFVISEEMGLEYCRRYGELPFLIHTDGVQNCPPLEYQPPSRRLKLYFMGMFNNSYVPNLKAVMQAMAQLQTDLGPEFAARFKLRTHAFKPGTDPGAELVDVCPPVSPEEIEHEMRAQDLLYLPLPFSENFLNLVRLSFSTKMVTYLASGVPIVYHGPADSAISHYLTKNDAAICINSTDPSAVAHQLSELLHNPAELHRVRLNAQAVARRDFDAQNLKLRFWNALLAS